MAEPQTPDAGSDVFSQWTLADFVADLASAKVAPGSGAAAAVVLALAAGCAAKAFTISEHHQPGAGLAEAAERARAIALLALEGAQRDGEDFHAWLSSHSSGAAGVLDQDAELLFAASLALEHLVALHGRSVSKALTPDIAAAEDFLYAFRAIQGRNRAELNAANRTSS